MTGDLSKEKGGKDEAIQISGEQSTISPIQKANHVALEEADYVIHRGQVQMQEGRC